MTVLFKSTRYTFLTFYDEWAELFLSDFSDLIFFRQIAYLCGPFY